MKKLTYLVFIASLILGLANAANAQRSTLNVPEAVIAPWTNDQLLGPAVLAAKLTGDHDHAMILISGR